MVSCWICDVVDLVLDLFPAALGLDWVHVDLGAFHDALVIGACGVPLLDVGDVVSHGRGGRSMVSECLRSSDLWIVWGMCGGVSNVSMDEVVGSGTGNHRMIVNHAGESTVVGMCDWRDVGQKLCAVLRCSSDGYMGLVLVANTCRGLVVCGVGCDCRGHGDGRMYLSMRGLGVVLECVYVEGVLVTGVV